MLLALSAALLTLGASQVAGTELGPADEPSLPSERSDPGARFAEPAQTGIPFQQYATTPPVSARGILVDLGVGSTVRTRTLSGSESGTVWATDIEVMPGASLTMDLSNFRLGAGYAARLTIPLASDGPGLAVLNAAYVRASWQLSPLWILGVEGSTIFGENSQLVPASTPGGGGPPPPVLNPIRTLSTYPYLSVNALLRAETQLSPRSRLRFSAGYFDVGGTGAAGETSGAQPRTWGPVGDATWDWQASPTATLSTSGSIVDTLMPGDFHVLLGTIAETWAQRFGPDLEALATVGMAASSTDTITFLTFSHFMPVASVGLRYFTDARHQFRFAFDAALAPYVDPYVRISYQRVTGTVGLEWYPTSTLFIGASAAAAWVPYSAKAPESYGTAGASVGWAIGRFVTIGGGAFTQTQFQGESLPGGSFRQWTTYVSLALRESFPR